MDFFHVAFAWITLESLRLSFRVSAVAELPLRARSPAPLLIACGSSVPVARRRSSNNVDQSGPAF